MQNEFTVVGEHRDDDAHLLVVGIDGTYYGYYPDRGSIARVELDDRWVMYEDSEPTRDGHPAQDGVQP